MENGQVLHSSLYVEQIDKFAVSLKQLAKTFLKLEEKSRHFQKKRLMKCLPAYEKKCVKNVRKTVGAGAKTIFRCIRWDTRFLQQ